MHCYYGDILERISEKPLWFDEYAVPRFCPFSPQTVASIYAKEVAFILIACQGCGEKFKVALSADRDTSLSDGAKRKQLWYGDPPNTQCCSAGPTMSSDSIKVLEFWIKKSGSWTRVKELEVDLEE